MRIERGESLAARMAGEWLWVHAELHMRSQRCPFRSVGGK